MARLGRSLTVLPNYVVKAAQKRQAAEREQLEPVRAQLFEKAELPCRSCTVAAPLRALKDDAQQCRMARAALGLGVRELAELADVPANTISQLEPGESLYSHTVETIRHVLEAAGAVLIEENGSGPGVRMAKSGDPLREGASLMCSQKGATYFPANFHFAYTAQIVYLVSASNGIAMLYNFLCCPPFTLEQATALATWSLIRPCGLAIRIAKDHERFPEVAMLFRHDPEDVRYLMNPTSSGTVILVGSLGGKWALPTVEAALAKVLTMERRAATTAKIVA